MHHFGKPWVVASNDRKGFFFLEVWFGNKIHFCKVNDCEKVCRNFNLKFLQNTDMALNSMCTKNQIATPTYFGDIDQNVLKTLILGFLWNQ